MVQTTEENPASGLDAAQIFGTGAQDGAGVQTIAADLFPDGVPADLIQVIDRSTSAIPDAVTRTRNTVRLVMCTPYYNLN